jgi:hypothetical protein
LTGHTPHLLPEDAGEVEIRDLVFRGHADVRDAFAKAFPEEIDACIAAIAKTYSAYRAFERAAPKTRRTAQVQAFVYTALNSIITSLDLLISGMITPAGHLMRQYAESTAMALLCSSPGLMTFARLEKEGKRYPVHDALRDVNNKKARRILDINAEGWNTFIEIAKFYDQFSHASTLVVSAQMMLDRPGMLVMLGDYDEGKADIYRFELIRRRSAAVGLEQLMVVLRDRLPFDPNEPLHDESPPVA